MSQNKTVFPGLGPEGDYQQSQPYSQPSQPYSRPGNQRQKGTVFPGMEQAPQNNYHGGYQPGNQQPQQPTRPAGKPVVGFLYSISRTGVGEFWPLHVGQNLIGNSPECDIILGEGTVSQRHASLHINKMKKPEKTEATISELGSTNGTLVNGTNVSMARPIECVNGDIITVGENYELLLLLIDTKEFGLSVSKEFIDVRGDEQPDYAEQNYSTGNDRSTRMDDFPPRFNGPTNHSFGSQGSQRATYQNTGPRPSDGTVGLDSNRGFTSGGTVGMDD